MQAPGIHEKKAKLTERLRYGVSPAMATPVDSRNWSVNLKQLPALIEFLIGMGASGLFIGGTTGEGILLSQKDRLALHESSLEVINGRIPALVHVGANTSTEAADLAIHAERSGADAMVAVTPYFYPLNDDSLFTFYADLASAAPNTPFFAYDIPHLARNSISPFLLERLISEVDSFAGIKTSSSDAQVVRKFIDIASGRALILAGNERIALGSLALGADGLISGLSTSIPEPFVKLVSAFESGDIQAAKSEQERINRLLDQLPSGARIGAIKAILNSRDIDVGPAIPPRPMPNKDWQGLSQMLSEITHP